MALRAVIRDFGSSDASAVVALMRMVLPHAVLTAEGLLHWVESQPQRARLRYWVAEGDGELVAWGGGHLRVAVAEEGVAWLVVGVHPDRRREGTGSQLYRLAEEHLLDAGARRIEAGAHEEAGKRFLRARGFRETRSERFSVLDPRTADLSPLAQLEAKKAAEGFRVVPLAAALDRRRTLHALYQAVEADMPSEHAHKEVPYEEWVREALEQPMLSREGSFVVLAGDKAVSLAWLLVDAESRKAFNDITGTLREYRRRGLARLAKLAAIRWAAESGITEIVTSNDSANAGMLALNRELAYEPLLSEQAFARDV